GLHRPVGEELQFLLQFVAERCRIEAEFPAGASDLDARVGLRALRPQLRPGGDDVVLLLGFAAKGRKCHCQDASGSGLVKANSAVPSVRRRAMWRSRASIIMAIAVAEAAPVSPKLGIRAMFSPILAARMSA